MNALRRRAGRLALAACLALSAGCRSTSSSDYREEPGPYDKLSPVELDVLAEARRLRSQGELELARRRLDTLAAALPGNLVAATALQDVELELLAAGQPVPAVTGPAAATPAAALYPLYSSRAEEEGTASACVLAARVAPDTAAREAWLERALAADATCVWAHYALAWSQAGERRYGLAWESLRRALALDPGHPSARRLEAALLARGGDFDRAIGAYRAWLERYADDPRLPLSAASEARLDLANLLVLANEPEEALAVLDAIDPALLPDAPGAGLARVTALDQLGRLSEALAEARRLAEVSPLDARPRVLEALLLSDRFDDPEGARAAWEDVFARLDAAAEAGGSAGADPAGGGLTAVFLRLEARAALARLAGEEEPEAKP